MGLFSSKKKIYVSSTVYNMAGDEEDRMNFLKSSLFGAVISKNKNAYIGETIVSNHLNGPGIKQRQFFNYALRKDLAGLPTLSVRNSYDVDPTVVKGEIPIPATPSGLVTEIQAAYVTDGDYSYFAEQYILQNHPELQNTNYVSDYDEETHTITIQYEGGATDVIPAGNYDPDKQFLIGYFFQHVPNSVESIETGTLVENVTDAANLPDTTGYTQDSLTNTGIVTHNIVTETTETRTYSDSTPTTVTVTNQDYDVDFNGTEEVLSIVELEDASGGEFSTTSLETFVHLFERRHVVDKVTTAVEINDLGGGVTETVTTEVDGGHLEEIWDHRTDTQRTINGKIEGGTQLFIYEMGSGNATLDALETTSTAPGHEYFPYIPLRINNRSVAQNNGTGYNYVSSGLYDESRQAYYKASGGGSFGDLIDEVEANDSIDDIDYCYLSYGVSLNTNENACVKYLYQFFRDLIPYQNTSSSYMTDFTARVNSYSTALAELETWSDAQSDPANPLYHTTRPSLPSLAQPETTTLKLKSDNYQTSSADNRISWISIHEENFTGQGKAGVEVGEAWLEKGQSFTWQEAIGLGNDFTGGSGGDLFDRFDTSNVEETFVYWQTSANSYKRLTIHGLMHRNFVYKGKSVEITAHEALDDPDTSGFIVPLHNPTVRAMSLIDSTQMATANTFLVFNSYEVVKQKWYQTFLGMLLIIIVVVVATVLLGPAGAAGVQGVLGTNIAVGAALGLSGTAAIVAGAVVNALAAIAISQAITSVSTEIFGEEWGAMIGAVISFAVTFGLSGGFTDFSMSAMLTPQNILGMSSAVANGYSGMVNSQIADMQEQAELDAQKYQDDMDDINDMIRDLGGSNDLSFDPMQLTNAAGNGQETGSYVPESLDEFIHRTTMTGTDVVDITLNLVSNYSDLNLALPDN